MRKSARIDPFAPSPSSAPQNGQAPKRQRILAAALKLFADDPYGSVTMDRVAEAAGVAKGTLYLYFDSKEALFIGILADALESVAAAYQSAVAPGANVTEHLRHAIEFAVRFYAGRLDLLRLLATEEPRMAADRNRVLDSWRERTVEFFSSLIAAGVKSGDFAPIDPRLATFAILGGIRSVMLYHGSARPIDEIGREVAAFMLGALGYNASSSTTRGAGS